MTDSERMSRAREVTVAAMKALGKDVGIVVLLIDVEGPGPYVIDVGSNLEDDSARQMVTLAAKCGLGMKHGVSLVPNPERMEVWKDCADGRRMTLEDYCMDAIDKHCFAEIMRP